MYLTYQKSVLIIRGVKFSQCNFVGTHLLLLHSFCLFLISYSSFFCLFLSFSLPPSLSLLFLTRFARCKDFLNYHWASRYIQPVFSFLMKFGWINIMFWLKITTYSSWWAGRLSYLMIYTFVYEVKPVWTLCPVYANSFRTWDLFLLICR
jgi:hypothetical protein